MGSMFKNNLLTHFHRVECSFDLFDITLWKDGRPIAPWDIRHNQPSTQGPPLT